MPYPVSGSARRAIVAALTFAVGVPVAAQTQVDIDQHPELIGLELYGFTSPFCYKTSIGGKMLQRKMLNHYSSDQGLAACNAEHWDGGAWLGGPFHELGTDSYQSAGLTRCLTGGTVCGAANIGPVGDCGHTTDNDRASEIKLFASTSTATTTVTVTEPETCYYVIEITMPQATIDALSTGASGDPHVHAIHGGQYDFRGEHDEVYNLLSHSNLSINALFQHVDYREVGPKRRLVHGSYMRALYVTARTNTSDVVRITYASNRTTEFQVWSEPSKDRGSEGKPVAYRLNSRRSVGAMADGGVAWVREGIRVKLSPQREFVLSSPEWTVRAVAKVKRGIINATSCATGKCFIEMTVHPLFDADHAAAAPHGLLGQAYDGDGIGVIGATDDYRGEEITTSAMGEGAIEGVHTDYKMSSPFATDFIYSRYGKTKAMPRDASKLTGKKVKLGVAVATVTADLTAWGDASDYKETSALQAAIASAAGLDVSASDVTIFVADSSIPGAFKITAAIAVPPATTSAHVKSAFSSAIGTAASASEVLGLIILDDPSITQFGGAASARVVAGAEATQTTLA